MKMNQLRKGIYRLLGCLFFCFLTPILITQAYNNEEHPMFSFVWIVGVLCMITTLLLGYFGIRAIFRSLSK